MQIFKEMFHNIALILGLSILYSFVYGASINARQAISYTPASSSAS
jgi:hypothetical protein